MTLLRQAATGADAIRLFSETQPAVTIMDLRLPDMKSIEAMLAIWQKFLMARIIVLTTYLDDVQAAGA